MEKETLAKHLKRYHYGAANAVTSRALERTYSVKGKELRDTVNALRRDGVPVASSGVGYFYAETEQEVRATIAHMTHRISGIAAAIRGLTMALEQFDTAQMTLLPEERVRSPTVPGDGAGGAPP